MPLLIGEKALCMAGFFRKYNFLCKIFINAAIKSNLSIALYYEKITIFISLQLLQLFETYFFLFLK